VTDDASERYLQSIAHSFGLYPWFGGAKASDWPLRRRLAWRVRHPRRWWRVMVENYRARER